VELIDAPSRILAGLLETRTGQQLALSRRWRIDTALAGLIRENGLVSVDQLAARVAGGRDPALAEKVVEALLNNETYFFRDRSLFNMLFSGPMKRLEAARWKEKRLSIWCAGCSTGQEVWSLAMTFAEEKLRWQDWKIEIIGTDISRAAIEQASEGVYSQFEVQRGLPVRQMISWFAEEPGQNWRISEALRAYVRFDVRGLEQGPPNSTRFDVILCRNVLLYFPAALRRDAFERMARAIAPDGCLMLGAGETAIDQTDRFISDPDNRGLHVPALTGAAMEIAARRSRIA
jgi:chemotaxis protein methyltransferase CheR